MGLDKELRTIREEVSFEMARIKGQQFDYTLFTDPVNGTTKLLTGIFIEATPTTWRKKFVGNTEVQTTDDIFTVSRKSLASGSIRFEPTNKDHFVPNSLTEPTSYVRDWEENERLPGSFNLLVSSDKGFSING